MFLRDMRFSVLLSLYYKENPSFLRQSLDSIFNQTLLPGEVVLVEDGPLTEALYAVVEEYIRKYPALKVVPLPENVGLGRALNEGLKHCSHELVARMDTDDISVPERFERQIALFSEKSDVDVCSAWIEEFADNPLCVCSRKKVPETHWEIMLYAKKRCPVNHPVVMYRKSALLSVGGYRHFPLLEDYYLWIRMLINGSKFYNIQESLLYFRTSPEMYRRRGGWAYLKNEIRFWTIVYQEKFISLIRFLINIIVRVPTRLCPNKLRAILYMSILRK